MKELLFLNILTFFEEMIESFKINPLLSLMPFFVGIVFGFMLCLLIYALVVVKSLFLVTLISSLISFTASSVIFSYIFS